jgi:uncharacterized protein (TIGR03435 family)
MKMWNMVSIVTLICLVGLARVQAQSFDVASIKPTGQDSPAMRMALQPGGRFVANNVSTKVLIKMAYGLFPPWPGPNTPVARQIGMGLPTTYMVDENEISGGLKWMDTDRFDISAKAEDEASPEQILLMLRSLLSERFQLKIHHETRDVPVYVLTVVKNGSKLRSIPDDGTGEGGINIGRGPEGATIRTKKTHLATLNKALYDALGRPVLDKTGITGFFDITLTWTPEAGERFFTGAPTSDNPAPSIFTAIQEQLGLRLEAQKGPGDVIVIDSAEKPVPK